MAKRNAEHKKQYESVKKEMETQKQMQEVCKLHVVNKDGISTIIAKIIIHVACRNTEYEWNWKEGS